MSGTLPLTRSECATITLLGQDLSQKAIAAELGISVSSVNTFVQRIYRKLDVRGPAAAALLHRDVHPWCGDRVDFAPILARIKTAQLHLVANDMTRPEGRGQHGGRRAVIVRRVEDAGARRALRAVEG